jgi:hypothetical protein
MCCVECAGFRRIVESAVHAQSITDVDKQCVLKGAVLGEMTILQEIVRPANKNDNRAEVELDEKVASVFGAPGAQWFLLEML